MNIIFEAPERTMAIVFQQPAGQPMFVPGVAPQTAVAQPMPTMASAGSVMYYPQMAGGAMIMVRARSSVLHDNSAYYVF